MRPPRLRSSETAVAGHRNCSHQRTLWRRSGGDRGIRRTGTLEGVLCERWDSRRGSIRRFLPYSLRGEESTREIGKGCRDWILCVNIYSVWPVSGKKVETLRKDRPVEDPERCENEAWDEARLDAPGRGGWEKRLFQHLAQTSGICQSIGASPASARSRLMCEKHRHPKNFLTDNGEGCAHATTAWCDCVINRFFF